MLVPVNVAGGAVLVSSKLGPLARSEPPIPQEGPLLGSDRSLFGLEACCLSGVERAARDPFSDAVLLSFLPLRDRSGACEDRERHHETENKAGKDNSEG